MLALKIKYIIFLPSTNYRAFFPDIDYFIKLGSPITAESFRRLLQNNENELLNNYEKLIPNNTPTLYHTLVPFHGNGLLKSQIDFRDFFSIKNINIKHFSSFLHHGDKHEYEKSDFLIQSLNGPAEINQKQFTIIYGLLISRPSSLLIREIEALSHEEAAFIIFYDNKSNRTVLYELFENQTDNEKLSNVYFVDSPRFKVDWGRITNGFTEIVMIQASLKFFPNSLYVSIHSESDYPLVPSNIIVKYLRMNYPKNYIQTLYDWNSQWKHTRRNVFRVSTFNKSMNEKINKMIRYLFPQKAMPEAKWRNGWTWFTITLKDSKLMIDTLFKRFDLVDFLEYCDLAEEIIFDTLVAEAGINSTNEYLRYIDWREKKAHPLTFNERHFKDIINHRCSLWARKFKIGYSDKVLDMIDEYVKNYRKNEFVC